MPDRPVPRLRLLRGGAGLTQADGEYRRAIADLRARGRFGVNLGLARIEALLTELGRPDRQLHGALVAGTNGKGSVVALIASVLRAAGHRTGTMPKPHLVSYRERIVVDGAQLDQDAFGAILREVLNAADRVSGPQGPATEFEVLTAAGFLALARERVQVAVVEVGLGGRLDATNAADLGVAAITTIQHDHERHLGRTLAAIGAEKAAIIKPGDLAVSGATGRGQLPIDQRCLAVGAPLVRVGPRGDYRATLRDLSWAGTIIDLETPGGRLDGLVVGLVGSHQVHNAAVAMAVLDALGADASRRGKPLALDPTAVRSGFADTRWAGRLERLSSPAGPIVLDGAHNPAGARVLAETLTALGVRDMPLVFGAMAGKRVTEVLRRLAPLRPRPVFTAVADPHALPPARLLRTWQTVTGIDHGPRAGSVAPDPAHALDRAEDLRHGTEPVVVSGSLYLVGAVRARLTGEEPDQ